MTAEVLTAPAVAPAIGVKALAVRLGIGRAAVYAGVNEEGWPHIRCGHGPRAAFKFTTAHIAEIEALRTVRKGPAVPPMRPEVSLADLVRSVQRRNR